MSTEFLQSVFFFQHLFYEYYFKMLFLCILIAAKYNCESFIHDLKPVLYSHGFVSVLFSFHTKHNVYKYVLLILYNFKQYIKCKMSIKSDIQTF